MEQEQVAGLIEEQIKTIFAYSLSRVSNREDAEDLCNDIVYEILISAPRLRDERAFFGYIWAIASNTYKKFLRKRERVRFAELSEDTPADDDLTDAVCRAEELNVLRRELSLLSREYRECTVAYYFEGLSCSETAAKLGISLEMVKYYLFKTRKLLKEGIGMDREFGEKSYNPGQFEFVTIFSGKFNAEYRNLFNRKLPGNLLLSAYYTPMTVRELSVELGVAAVYIEDEISLLEKYHLLRPTGAGKYQTNLIIFTEGYTAEFNRTAEKRCSALLGDILQRVKEKLPEIRKIGFPGSDADDDRLLWAFLFPLMRSGHTIFEANHSGDVQKSTLYNDATGTNYGVDFQPGDSAYDCTSFAGYCGIADGYAASFADFGILPKENRCCSQQELKAYLRSVQTGIAKAEIPILERSEYDQIKQLLAPEAERFGQLYEALYSCALEIMKIHAPKGVSPLIENVTANTLFFRTVGWFGACAVHSGGLTLPEHPGPAAVLIYRTSESGSGKN